MKHYYFYQLVLPSGNSKYGIVSSKCRFSPYYDGWVEIRKLAIANLKLQDVPGVSMISGFYLYFSQLNDDEIQKEENSINSEALDLKDIQSDLDCFVFSYCIASVSGGLLSGVCLFTYKIFTTKRLTALFCEWLEERQISSTCHKLISFDLIYSGNVGKLQEISKVQAEFLNHESSFETVDSPSIFLK